MLGRVAGDVLVGPSHERGALDLLPTRVEGDLHRFGSGFGLHATHSGGPRLVVLQGCGQWHVLAQEAAQVGGGAKQVGPVRLVLLGRGEVGGE